MEAYDYNLERMSDYNESIFGNSSFWVLIKYVKIRIFWKNKYILIVFEQIKSLKNA